MPKGYKISIIENSQDLKQSEINTKEKQSNAKSKFKKVMNAIMNMHCPFKYYSLYLLQSLGWHFNILYFPINVIFGAHLTIQKIK